MFAWNGSPSEIPIAYQPGGTNPSISRYLRKKHCNSCGANGFITPFCPTCTSSDVIQYFYRDFASVPNKINWYGEVPCLCSQFGEMTGECPRDGRILKDEFTGFLSNQQMLMHATSKHPREYSVWQTISAGKPAVAEVDVDKLREGILAQVRAEMGVDSKPSAESIEKE
jgi:hypothetical protein